MNIADISTGAIDAFGAGRAMRREREQEQQGNRLRQIASELYRADPSQRQGLVSEAIGIDPQAGMSLDQSMRTLRDDRTKRLGVMAKALLSQPEEMRPQIYKSMQGELQGMGMQGLPAEYDETVASTAQQLAQVYDMTIPESRTEGRVVGNALVDPYTGKVLYQGERQQNRQLVQDAEGNYYSVDPSDPGNATPVQIGGGSPVPQVGASNPQQAYRDAIAGIESAGSGDYSALGPVTKSGDRAYGRYQVMGANIPEWTLAALGRRLTPQEFLADADAQNAVFDHRFGSYAKKYGPEGAARAWFAGEGGMNKPGARDVLGTSVQGYGQKFVAGLGGRQLRGAGKGSQSGGKASDWQVIQGQDGQFYRFNKLDGRVESAGVTGANAIRTADQQQKRAEAAAGIQGAIASTDQTIQQIDLLLRHPGRESGTGFSAKIPAIPGTDRKGFDAQLATFKAQTFIPMVSQLKGMGALSDAEGKKLTEAIGALDPEMPEAEFAASLNRIKTQLYRAQKLAYDKLAATRRNGGAVQPSPKAAQGGDISDLLTKYGGG